MGGTATLRHRVCAAVTGPVEASDRPPYCNRLRRAPARCSDGPPATGERCRMRQYDAAGPVKLTERRVVPAVCCRAGRRGHGASSLLSDGSFARSLPAGRSHAVSKDTNIQQVGPSETPDDSANSARLEAFIRTGGRAVVLVGPPGSGKTATLDRALARLPNPVARIGNPLSGPLTAKPIQFRIGAGDENGGDVEALLRNLGDRARNGEPTLVVVDEAHSLTPEALASLARVPALTKSGRPAQVLILVGHPALLTMITWMDFESLRDPAITLTIVLPISGELQVTRATVADSPVPLSQPAGTVVLRAPPHTPRRAHRRRLWPLLAAGGTTVVLGAAVLFVRPDSVASFSPNASPPPPTRAPIAQSQIMPPLAAPSLVPAPPSPAQSQTGGQLRRDFDAFLDRAGRDTAPLTPAARAKLLREYLDWRARTDGKASTDRVTP
jgi:AAA domain